MGKKGRIILTLKHKAQTLNQSLEKIISGCQRNEVKAQKELFDLFGEKMFGICLRYAGCSEDAKDILQDGFLKVYEKIQQFKNKGSFEGWMRRIFVNTALEKYRGQYKIINIQDNRIDFDDQSYEDISSIVSAKELVKIIGELSVKYRTVFNLYAIEGYSHKEIAEMLNISEGTSKSNLSRARAILQEKVINMYRLPIQIGL